MKKRVLFVFYIVFYLLNSTLFAQPGQLDSRFSWKITKTGGNVSTLYKISADNYLIGGSINVNNVLYSVINVNSNQPTLINSPKNQTIYAIDNYSSAYLLGGEITSKDNPTLPEKICSIDNSFTPNSDINTKLGTSGINSGFDGNVYSIKYTSNGSILVGGAFNRFKNVDCSDFFVLLNSDYSLNSNYTSGGFQSVINAIAILDNNYAIVGGEYGSYNANNNVKYIAKLDYSTGLAVQSFSTSAFVAGVKSKVQAVYFDNTSSIIYSGGDFGVVALTTSGTLSGSQFKNFTYNGSTPTIKAIAVEGNYLIVGGIFDKYDGITVSNIVRINLSDRTIDNDFIAKADGAVDAIIIDDGTALLGGRFNIFNGDNTVIELARILLQKIKNVTITTSKSICPGEEVVVSFDIEGSGLNGYQVSLYKDNVYKGSYNATKTGNTLKFTLPKEMESGNYNVFVESLVPSLKSVNSDVLTIKASPLPRIVGVDTLCVGNEYSYDAFDDAGGSGNSYTWTVPSYFTADNKNQQKIKITLENATATKTDSIKVTINNPNGCSNTFTKIVYINIKPNANIKGKDTVCNFSTEFYTSDDIGYYKREWKVQIKENVQTINVTNDNKKIEVFWNVPASITDPLIDAMVILELSSGKNCIDIDTMYIKIHNPNLIITGDFKTFWGNTTYYNIDYSKYKLTKISLWGGTINGKLTYPYGADSSKIQVIWNNKTVIATDSLVVQYTANLCSFKQSFSIRIQPKTTTIFSINDLREYCSGDTVEYELENLLLPKTYIHRWSISPSANGEFINGTQDSVVAKIKWNIQGKSIVKVNYKNGTINKDLFDTNYVTEKPAPKISGINNVCVGKKITFSPNTSTFTNSWKRLGNLQADVVIVNDNFEVTWKQSGFDTLILTQTNGICVNSDILFIKISSLPLVSFAGNTFVALNSSETYTTDNIDTIKWGSLAGKYSNSTTALFQVSWDTAGSGNVSLTKKNENGCDSTYKKDVIIANGAIVTGQSNACIGDTKSFSINAANYDSYKWEIVKGKCSIANSSSQNSNITFSEIGDIELLVTITKAGKVYSGIYKIVVNPKPEAKINEKIDNNEYDILLNQQIPFNAKNISNCTYEWFLNDVSVSKNISYNFQQSAKGKFKLVLKVTNTSGCLNYDTLNISVTEKIVFEIKASQTDYSICENGSVKILFNAPTGSQLSWTTSSDYIIDANNNFTSNLAKVHKITLTATNGIETDTKDFNITVYAIPDATISGSLIASAGMDYNYTPEQKSSNPVGTSYEWEVNGKVESSNETFIYKFTSNGQYKITLKATKDNGSGAVCVDTKEITVNVSELKAKILPSFTDLVYKPGDTLKVNISVDNENVFVSQMEYDTKIIYNAHCFKFISPVVKNSYSEKDIKGYTWKTDTISLAASTKELVFLVLWGPDENSTIKIEPTKTITDSNVTVKIDGIKVNGNQKYNKKTVAGIINVSPNPNNGAVKIECSVQGEYLDLYIVNELGSRVLDIFKGTNMTINEQIITKNLQKGIYFIIAESDIITTEKMIIIH